MIVRQYNCLFVHIPKTAGKSIEQFFLDLMGLTWDDRAPFLLRPNSDPAQGPERLAHLTASEYVSCGHLTGADFESLYRFSFVRNPWARLVSEYRYRDYARHYSFADFVRRGLPEPGLSDAYRHILPQYDFLHDANGDLQVDFVGRFEELQKDFDRVCKKLNIPGGELPHVEAQSSWPGRMRRRLQGLMSHDLEPRHSTYTEYYDSETRERVAEIYALDIEAFGYEFGR